MAYTTRDQHLTLTDRDGKNPIQMTVHDDADAITFGFDVRLNDVRVSMGVQLGPTQIDALMQRLTDIREVRGW